MKKKIFTLTLLSCLAFILCTSVASAQSSPRRLALVIGNADYPQIQIQDAVNSATTIAETLRNLNFQVQELHNLDRQEMYFAINAFTNSLSKGDIALFYYAGIGIDSYLLPAKREYHSDGDIEDNSILLHSILDSLQTSGALWNMFILDVCYYLSFLRRSPNTSSLSELDVTQNMLVAYLDNRPCEEYTTIYVDTIAEHIVQPNITLLEVFHGVEYQIRSSTNDRLRPQISLLGSGNFTFNPDSLAEFCENCDTPLQLSIMFPQDTVVLQVPMIELIVNLSQKPSGSVDWLVWLNGQPITIDAVSLAPESFGTSQTYTLSLRLPEHLANSSFELKAQAFDANNRAISDADTIQLSYIPAREPDLYLLAVGVDKYEDSRINDLSFAVEDAESFADLFRNQAGGLYRNVHIVTLTDEKATVANVQIALENLRAEVQENDVVMVFFAAHGDSKVSGQKEKYYIMLHDSNLDAYEISALPQQDITSFVQEVKGHTFMFIDTCHSGMSTVRNLPSPTDNLVRDFGVAAKTHTSGIDGRVIEIFAASQGSQPAQEQTRLGHGVFTQAIIQGIRDAEALDERRGVVTNSSLFDWIDYRVLELTNQYQKPHRDGSGGVFVLWQPSATAH